MRSAIMFSRMGRFAAHAVAHSVLRNIRDAAVADFAYGLAFDVGAVDEDFSLVNGQHAAYKLGDFILTVALDSRNTNDFACADIERDSVDKRVLFPSLTYSRFFTATTVCFGLEGFLSSLRITSRPTIMREILTASRLAMLSEPTVRPARSTVTLSQSSITSSSLCEINMMDIPSFRKFLSCTNSSSVSCGGQHGSRLVENKYFAFPYERF